MRRQFYDLMPGDTVTIGNSRVTVEAKTGQRARLKIESNEPVQRGRPERAVARPFQSPEPRRAPAEPVVPLQRPTFKAMPSG